MKMKKTQKEKGRPQDSGAFGAQVSGSRHGGALPGHNSVRNYGKPGSRGGERSLSLCDVESGGKKLGF